MYATAKMKYRNEMTIWETCAGITENKLKDTKVRM